MFARVKDTKTRNEELYENSTKLNAPTQNPSQGKKALAKSQIRHNQSVPTQPATASGSVNEN